MNLHFEAPITLEVIVTATATVERALDAARTTHTRLVQHAGSYWEGWTEAGATLVAAEAALAAARLDQLERLHKLARYAYRVTLALETRERLGPLQDLRDHLSTLAHLRPRLAIALARLNGAGLFAPPETFQWNWVAPAHLYFGLPDDLRAALDDDLPSTGGSTRRRSRRGMP